MLRVGIVADYREEGWASMDLMADMLLQHLPSVSPDVAAVKVQPPFRHRVGRLRRAGRGADVTDRIVNRFFDYPRWLRAQNLDLDVYHVVDHSYAHLVLALPPERTVVTCHDIDAFRLFTGGRSASMLPRRLARRVLDGLRAARLIICDTEATRSDLVRHGLVPVDRLHVVAPGAHPSCSASANHKADQEAASLLGPAGRAVDLLHVGTTIDRKRIDVLIDAVATIASHVSDVRLIRVGGPLTAAQRRQAAQFGIESRIYELPFLDRETLAAVYRRAALVLVPSEYEGFGLPVVEALACGTPVVASDIAALREVGGPAVVLGPVGDPLAWAQVIIDLLSERAAHPGRWQARCDACLTHGQGYTWLRCATETVALYGDVVARAPVSRCPRQLRIS